MVSSDYPPMSGGIARFSHQMARGLALRHEVHVVAACHNRENAREFDREQPYPTRRVPAAVGLRELALASTLYQENRTFQPDLVWSALWLPDAVLAQLLTPRSRHAFSAHAAEFMPSTATWRKRLKCRLLFLLRFLFRSSDGIFAVSRFTRDQLVNLGAAPARIRILSGGVADDWFEVAADRGPRPKLLTVARLDPNKGHDLILEALAALKPDFPDLQWIALGPVTPHLSTLKARAEALGVADMVTFRGRVSEPELRRAYAEADLFVLASRQEEGYVEGFGLVFLEAAAAGLPSVAARAGGIPDAVEHETTGLLVDPSSPQELTAALRRLLSDSRLRLEMGERARQRAWDCFRWSGQAERLVAETCGWTAAGRIPGRSP